MKVLKHVPSQVAELVPYEPGRPIEEVAREMGLNPDEIVKLASNESALGVSRLAKRAMKKAVDEMFLYPDGGGYSLRSKIAGRFGVEQGNVILGNGSNEILEFIGHAFMGEGKNIVVSEYAFIVYRLTAKMFGAEIKEVPTRKNFTHNLTEMAKAIDENTSVVFICNPNNPTGSMVTAAEIRKFMDKVPEDVLIVFDEAYAEICLGRMPDTMKYVVENRNCIVLRTFSKAYGLAGLRVGYGIGPKPIIDALQKPRQPFNCNRMAQIAAEAALDDQGFVRRCRALYRKGKAYMEAEFQQMGLEFVPTSANFILVKTGQGRTVFQELQKRGVIIRPMDGYGLPEWVRVNFGTIEENKIFIEKLKEVLKS